MKHRIRNLKNQKFFNARALSLVILLSLPFTMNAGILFQDDFEPYNSGSNLIGQGGWSGGFNGGGTPTVLVNTASQLSGISLAGPVNSGLNQIVVIGNALAGPLESGSVYTLNFDAYAKTTVIISHSSGLGFFNSSAILSGSLAKGVMWSPVKNPGGLPSGTFGWVFDARPLTGNGSNFVGIPGGYDTVANMSVVVDAVLMETYGVYDFGGGSQETPHFSFTEQQLAGLDAVGGFADYRGVNGGATTAQGDQFIPPEFDNVVLSDNNLATAPTLSTWGIVTLVLMLGFFSVMKVRRMNLSNIA